MGRKQKKGLSSRLAKMSDDERARYLQHRAAIEEEAKRRKEQLISTYMKNKIKKEEAFTRLNIAKINEYWHQILRKHIVKKMKTEITNLSKWILNVVDFKNKILNNLMIEIEESGQQYGNNFKSHSYFTNQFLDMHYQRQEDMTQDFEIKNMEILTSAENGMSTLTKITETELSYLKTVIFALEKNFNNTQKKYKNHKQSLLEEYLTTFRAEHSAMITNYIKEMDNIWRNIYNLLFQYLSHTSARRHHYIEQKHLDDRNKLEREENEDKIAKYKNELNKMKHDMELYRDSLEPNIINLTTKQDKLYYQQTFLKNKLNATLKKDNTNLKLLTSISNNSLSKLQDIILKSKDIHQVLSWCRRLETQEERDQTWENIRTKWYTLHSLYTSDDEKDLEKSKAKIDSLNESDVTHSFKHLYRLRSLWWVHNKIKIEIDELKKERIKLSAENNKYNDIIKGILQDAVLEQSSFNVPPLKARPVISSAPVSLGSSKWAIQIPPCVDIAFK